MKENRSHIVRDVVIVVLAMLFVVTEGIIYWQNVINKSSNSVQVVNYADCIKSDGSVLQESYPEICVTKAGERFTNPDQNVTMPNPPVIQN